jgi:hypothetical protein
MTLEEAKVRLLNPPAEPPRPSWLKENAVWMVPVAAAVGFIAARPARVGKLSGKAISLIKSPVVQKAAIAFVMNLSRKHSAQQ